MNLVRSLNEFELSALALKRLVNNRPGCGTPGQSVLFCGIELGKGLSCPDGQ